MDTATPPISPSVRDRFPIFATKTYINSCSQGALSTDVSNSYLQYLADRNAKGAAWSEWMELASTARQEFAALIGADADEVAINTSTSAAVSSLSSCMEWPGERDTVVVTDFEFPTIGQIWHAQERRGARVTHVSAHEGNISLEQFASAIDDRTRLVSLTHVSFRDGSKLDIPAIIDLAHERGARVLLDSYQALGTMEVNVKALDVDFLVCGTVKYLLGSAGLAFLYVRRDLIEEMVPTTLGWFSQRDIFAMNNHSNDPARDARRFEMGTPPVPNLYAGIAGIKLIRTVGTSAIERHIAQLTHAIRVRAVDRGFRVVTPAEPSRHGAIIALHSSNVNELRIRLSSADVVVSGRGNNLRISPHIYNNTTDIDRLFTELERSRELLL